MLLGGNIILNSATEVKAASQQKTIAQQTLASNDGVNNDESVDQSNSVNLNTVDRNALLTSINTELNSRNLSSEKAEKAKQEMLNFFDPNNANYMNLDSLDDWEDTAGELPVNGTTAPTLSKHGLISVGILGSALNVAIGAALGGIGGGVLGAIKKKGKAWVRRKVATRVKATLINMKLDDAAALVSGAIDFALDYTDPGAQIAKYLDEHDKKSGNGYLEWW